jgi:enoyl-CoA hydratase/carnithine racemase
MSATTDLFRSGGIDADHYQARHIQWVVEGPVATITLNRPERKNPLTFESYAELRDLFRALVYSKTIKSVVVTGAGGNFCSGGDVHEIIGPLVELQQAGDMSGLLAFTRMTGDLVKAMRAAPQPIIAAVDGICAGAGAILAMASDLRFGTPASKVAFLFVRVGLAGADMGACNILPRIIGSGRAALLPAAQQMAASLASGPTFAHALTKRCIHEEWSMGIDAAIEAEAQAQAICMQTRDFERAYRAFVDKQKPVFEGN